MPTPGLGTRRPGWPALFEAPAAAELFHAPLRKSVTGGAIKAIAIFTIGDAEMQRHWRAYAERFVQLKGGGVAFGAKTQAEVAARLNKLHNTDVANVYFIGHGYAGGTHPRNPRLFRLPTFMLSGVHNGGTFANNSDPAKNLTPEPGPLIEALAPHLSRDYAVNMYFLSCHTGTNNVMQEGMVKLVRRYAPGVAITVYGYKQYYGVEKNMAPRAHVRESKKDPPPDPNTFVAPDKVPEGYSYASYGDRFKGDDPLKEIDENRTDDPLFGL